MKISTRLKLAELVCVAVVAISVAMLLSATANMKRELARNAEASELLAGVTALRYLTLEYALTHEVRVEAQWRLRSASLGTLLANARVSDSGVVAELERSKSSVDKLFTLLVDNHHRLIADASRRAVLDELESRLSAQISNRAQGMIVDALGLAERSRSATLAAQQRANVAVIAAGAVILVVVGLTIFVTVRSVTRPLQRLQEGTAQVGEGRLDFVLAMDSRDEIGALARAFDSMTQRLRATTVSRDELARSHAALEAEMAERQQAERKVHAQLGRLNLLHQITRSIGERQDLRSIFQVLNGCLEDQLPVDFACICLHDATHQRLSVTSIGSRSMPTALQIGLQDGCEVPIDANGLSRCMGGELIYEDDIAALDFPFPQRLAGGGLRSLVLAPLLAEKTVFGVLVVARRASHSFASGECEFLRQLSEHAALASNQARLYADLQRAYDDLRMTQQSIMQQERLRALGQMASGIAHDINNAISPVALYTESLLETETGLSQHGRECLEVIERAIDDVAATVARMREFYRQREPQLTLASVDLNRMARQVAELTRARWSDMPQQRGVVVQLEAALLATLPYVMGVEAEIREALTNLIFNAVDAMPDGGTLSLRTGVSGPETAWIEVADSGVGMSEDTRQRCMEPFFTTKGERGTGLGLAMVYGMLERHSADIDITTAPGQGTAVRLSFLVRADTPAAPSAPVAVPSGLRILIVDDDPVVLKSLQDALRIDGHEVVAAEGGQAGIARFREAREAGKSFSAVITDLGMPYVDGRKVALAIKEISPATPVILLTGWGQRMMAENEAPGHVDCVLSKPPKLRELREALAGLALSV